MKAVVMPSLGVAMTEGLVVRWLKSAGDPVAKGEPILEIETDKALMDVESPAAGLLGDLLFAEGALVPIGVTMTSVIEPMDATDRPAHFQDPSVTASPPEPTLADDVTPTSTPALGTERTPHRTSPRQRAIARTRQDTDAADLGGSPGGS